MKECKNCQGNLLLTEINCSLSKLTHFKYAKCEDCGKIYLYTKEDLLCIDVFDAAQQISMFNEFARNMIDIESIESRDINVAHDITEKPKVDSDVFEDDDDDYDDLMNIASLDDEDLYPEEEHECNCENCTCHDDEEDTQLDEELEEFIEAIQKATTATTPDPISAPATTKHKVKATTKHKVKAKIPLAGANWELFSKQENVPTEHAPYVEEPIVPKDIEHQVKAKEFGDYLIITDEFGDNDMLTFTGSKDELNDYLVDLKLHSTPKVYMLKQLKVDTVYKIQ